MSCFDNNSDRRPCPGTGGSKVPDGCCIGETGCIDFKRDLSNVRVEPIYVQKVYDSALFHLQHLINGMGVTLTPRPAIPTSARIVKVTDIRCRKYFNADGTSPEKNLTITPTTNLQGAKFVKCANGEPVSVIGPDGLASQNIISIDTDRCDKHSYGTSIYGTQSVAISGNLEIEIDVEIRENCGRKCKSTLKGLINVSPAGPQATNQPLIMTNFFELCVPSTNSGAFLPRFAELCNLKCEPKLATNNLDRDFTIETNGTVTANIVTALCVSCEKKIIVPVQLCVLSTGFPDLSPVQNSICKDYPSLFPNQIDERSVKENKKKPKDEGCCGSPSNRPQYRGLSLSEDEMDDFEEV